MAKYPDVTAGQTEACINRVGGWNNFLRFIGGSGRIVFETILTVVREVALGVQSAVTTSAEYFKDAGVVWTNNNFDNQFVGLKVPAAPSTDFIVRKLEQNSLDAPIIAELGGEKNAEISVSHFKDFLQKNRKSTEWFIFYLNGKDRNLWAVDVYWLSDDGGWNVNANSVSDPSEWYAGSRVVSRK
jgi:hypothetical protein